MSSMTTTSTLPFHLASQNPDEVYVLCAVPCEHTISRIIRHWQFVVYTKYTQTQIYMRYSEAYRPQRRRTEVVWKCAAELMWQDIRWAFMRLHLNAWQFLTNLCRSLRPYRVWVSMYSPVLYKRAERCLHAYTHSRCKMYAGAKLHL